MRDTVTGFKHSAFVSYSHVDRVWGEWLQRALERYAVPADLVGRTTANGVVPRTLYPVFRDRWDLAAGHALDEQIETALAQSGHLVVICSPNAAKSAYVNEEIWRFKAMGREKRILALIVGGRPGDPEHECFPEALRRDRTPDGEIGRSLHTPLAADARPEGDGKELAKLKIVAGILGVPLDDIRKREEIEQRRLLRRARAVAASMGALALLAVAGAGAAVWAYGLAEDRRLEAEKRYDQALDLTLKFVTASATFRTLLKKETDFEVEQIEGKRQSGPFKDFIQRSKKPEDLWLKLVRVLLDYTDRLPAEFEGIHTEVYDQKLPLRWARHAETIVGNLSRTYGERPEYAREQERIAAVLGGYNEEPRKTGGAADCVETAAGPQGGFSAEMRNMRSLPPPNQPMQGESPVQMPLAEPCRR